MVSVSSLLRLNRVEIMKSAKSNESGFGLFASATEVSQPLPWFMSLHRHIQESREERKHPHAKFEITAQRDPTALKKLIESPSAFGSLVSQMWGLIDDTLHPRTMRATAAPVEVREIWSRPNTTAPRMMSAAIHGMLLVLVLMPWTSLAKKPPRVNGTVVTVYTPVNLVLNLPQKESKSGGGGGGGKREKTPPSFGRLPRAIVRKDGTIDIVRIVRSLGFGLDEKAIEALKQWRFRPGMRNTEPVDVSLNVEVNFNLR